MCISGFNHPNIKNGLHRNVKNVKIHNSVQADFLLHSRYKSNIHYEVLSQNVTLFITWSHRKWMRHTLPWCHHDCWILIGWSSTLTDRTPIWAIVHWTCRHRSVGHSLISRTESIKSVRPLTIWEGPGHHLWANIIILDRYVSGDLIMGNGEYMMTDMYSHCHFLASVVWAKILV